MAIHKHRCTTPPLVYYDFRLFLKDLLFITARLNDSGFFFPQRCGVGFLLSLTFTNSLKISERLSSTYMQLPELLSLSVPKIC